MIVKKSPTKAKPKPAVRKPRPARIAKTPGVCGGDACVRGTRIPVWGLVEAKEKGYSDADIVGMFPSVTKADLKAAWRYARLHAREIKADIAANAL